MSRKVLLIFFILSAIAFAQSSPLPQDDAKPDDAPQDPTTEAPAAPKEDEKPIEPATTAASMTTAPSVAPSNPSTTAPAKPTGSPSGPATTMKPGQTTKAPANAPMTTESPKKPAQGEETPNGVAAKSITSSLIVCGLLISMTKYFISS